MICPNCGTRLPVGITKCHFCGNEIIPAEETNFVHKFVALFTLMVIFLALVALFYSYDEGIISDNIIRLFVSTLEGGLITCVYWLLTPLMMKTLIDPLKLKPRNEDIWWIILSTYFILVVTIYWFIYRVSPQGFIALFIGLTISLILTLLYLTK